MQYTDVFGFKKPEYAEEADVVDLNDNMDDIDDTLYKIRRLSGLVYDATTTSSNPYVAGNYTINPTDGLMYKCTDTTYGAWDSTKWTRTDEFSELELAMQSGGGGGGSGYTETTLWSGNETPSASGSDINLSGNISDYDMIAIHVGDSSYSGDNIFIVDNLTIGETYISTVYHGGNLGAFFTYTSDTQINIKAQGSNYPQTYTKVVGISFGSGGGSSSGGTHYDTTEQVIGTWVDGRDVYRKLVTVQSTWQNIGTGANQSFAYQENWVKEIDFVTNAIAVSSEQYAANMFHVSVITDRVNGIAVAYWNDAFGGSVTSMYVDYVILEYVKVVPST